MLSNRAGGRETKGRRYEQVNDLIATEQRAGEGAARRQSYQLPGLLEVGASSDVYFLLRREPALLLISSLTWDFC